MTEAHAVGFMVGFMVAAIPGLVSMGAAKRNGMWDGFMASMRTGDQLYIDKVKPVIDRFDDKLWNKAEERNNAAR